MAPNQPSRQGHADQSVLPIFVVISVSRNKCQLPAVRTFLYQGRHFITFVHFVSWNKSSVEHSFHWDDKNREGGRLQRRGLSSDLNEVQ